MKAKANYPIIIKNPSKRLPVEKPPNQPEKKVTFSEEVKVKTIETNEDPEEESASEGQSCQSGDSDFGLEMGDLK